MTDAGVTYSADVRDVTVDNLDGFFEGWPNPPSAATLKTILEQSYRAVVARDDTGAVVGFVNAISDGVLCAFIPLLEVRPEFRGRGIGRSLVTRLLADLESMYSVDLACDDDLVPFYERLGFVRGTAMLHRRR